MAFFQQLRLLLWKNGLGVIRQPGWSLTLIIWPLVIFIILAITRHQFPTQLKDACYVAPRNLPSTGFFPFLQTLMCNTDSTCHNKSRRMNLHGSKHNHRDRRSIDAGMLEVFPSSKLMEDMLKNGAMFGQEFKRSRADQAPQIEILNRMIRSTKPGKPSNISLMDSTNNTPLGDQGVLTAMLESMSMLKKSICTLALSVVNTSSVSPLTYATVTFCKSNDTLLEVSLITINQILTELMLSNPNEVVAVVGQGVMVYDLLQKETRLWESLLSLPRLLAPASLDQALNDIQFLLTNVQGAMHAIQKSYPEAGASISLVHPYLAGGINLLQYIQGWPGRDVYIPLGDFVSLENDTLSEMVRSVLQLIRIPLDKAIGLTLDKGMVHSYICDNSSNPVVLAACATGTVDMLLGWISPDKVAKQTLLAWSKSVALGDVAFARGLLLSLMGGSGGQGGSNNTRSQRSVNYTQPQNIEEELFLSVGHVILDILRSFPELDKPVHSFLRASHTSMQTASLAIDTVEEMIDNILKDASHLQKTFLTLMRNQSEASAWIGQVLDSMMDMVMKILMPTGPLTCESLLRPFQWLLSSNTVDPSLWSAMICQNSSVLEQALLMDWVPLIQKVQELNQAIMGQAVYEITLPMILSEWHRLSNTSLNLGVFLDKFARELGVNYWMDWLPQNITYDMAGTLLQRVVLAMGTLGEKFEKSYLWPQAKPYVHMVNWIVNYQPGISTQPPNCSLDVSTFAIHCDTGLIWPQFAQATAHVLLTIPNKPDILISCLKATVNLLQHVYGDVYKYMAASYLNQGIPGGNALSAHLINLLNRLDGYVQQITTLSDSDLSNTNLMLPLTYNLLQSTGLTPLMPLLSGEGPLNISTLVGVAVKLGRLNQHIFTFNDSDPSLPELERLMIIFLSMEGNLTLPLSLSMGQTLLTYSGSLRPEDVARLIEAIRPFTNQTSAGIVEAVLRAMELLKQVMNAPNGDPTHIILGYVRQLQEFLASALRLRRIDQLWLPNGQLSTAQVTDLYLVAMDILKLVTPEGLQILSQAGSDAAQQAVIEKILALLPHEVQQRAFGLIQDLQTLINQMSFCTTQDQNCVAGVTEIFRFLEQIVEMVLEAEGNVTITLAPTNPFLKNEEALRMTATLFTLFLSQRDAAYLKTFNQTLYFLKLVLATPNITVSDVLAALRQANLTLEELNAITALAGAANINELMVHIMAIVNVHQCFMPQQSPVIPAQCVMGLVSGITGFLTNVPALQNQTAILSLIPVLINKTITDVVKLDFSDPLLSTIQVLNSTLASVKLGLQLIHLNSPEIMNEIRVVEGLLKLAANMQPFNLINTTLIGNPLYAQKVYLDIAEWYLKKLENVTSTSAFTSLLYPFYRLTEMQVAIQLAQTDFSLFISNQVEHLLRNLQYPIDGTGVSMIGQTAIEILRHQVELIKVNLEIQNDYYQSIGFPSPFNITEMYFIDYQVDQYLNLIANWMRDPSVTSVLTSMLQWGSPSLNISTPGRDFHQLLMTMAHLFTPEQQVYLSAISHITQALNSALIVAEQPGGLQSVHFSDAILEAAKIMMQSLTAATGPIPLAIREKVLRILQDSLRLIVNPQLGYATSRNITLHILKRAEAIFREIIPEMAAQYLLAGIQVATTYLETISTSGGPEKWNEIILKEMETIQSLLPPNSTVQAYISAIINITHFILESGQGSMSLWSSFGNVTLGNVAGITGQIGNILNTVLHLITGDPGFTVNIPSLEVFAGLGPVLEQILTGQANKNTWHMFEKMLEALLSAFKGTPLWDPIPPVATMIEKVVGAVVNSMQAENAMILGLQTPLTALMTEIAHAVNISQLDLAAVSERMLLAIQLTVEAAEQANGTLECKEALKAWEPVGEAAGLSQVTMGMWCNVSLQPLLEAYAAAQSVYTSLSMSNSGVGPMTVNATAARLVEALRSLYQVNVNRTLIAQQLIMTFSDQLSMLGGQPLSLEVQAQWSKQFLDMQLRQSLAAIRLLSDQLLSKVPSLQPFLEAVERALSHILNNYHSIQNGTSAEELLTEAGVIILTSLNITSDSLLPVLWGNFSMIDGMTVNYVIKEVVKLIVQMKVFGDVPMVYQAMEQFIASNDTTLIVEKLAEIFAWLGSNQVSLMELLTQALPRVDEAFKAFLSFLTQMNLAMPAITDVFSDLVGNIIAMLRQMASTSNLLAPLDHYLSQLRGKGVPYETPHTKLRQRREAPLMPPMPPMRQPINDFIDLFYIDYTALFKAAAIPPTVPEIVETAHVFFANPNLALVMNGVTRDMPWGLNSSKEETIDAALGVFSYLTLPNKLQRFSLDMLTNIIDMLPDGLPFVPLIKKITKGLARESQENRLLIQQTMQTISELLNTSLTDQRFPMLLSHLTSQVCTLEKLPSMQQLVQALYVTPGLVCQTVMPSLQILAQSLRDGSELSTALFQIFIGDPSDYDINTNWTSVFSESFGLNTSSLMSLNINITSPGVVKVGEMLRNKTAFVLDVQRHTHFDPHVLSLLMETPLPNNNLVILSWLLNLRHCGNLSALYMNQTDEIIFRTFCSMSAQQWYSFSLLISQHVNTEKLIYRLVLSEDMQSVVGVMLQMAKFLTEMMQKVLPAIKRLLGYLSSMEDLNLMASREFRSMMRGQIPGMSSKATFTTLSRAMCSNGIMALFGIAKLPMASESDPSLPNGQQREEMIEKFKIPRTASPFCMNLYLDMVNTTGGAIAWAFLKPMLMGHILYTPNTPLTRTIMEKSNATLQEFANLRMYSEDWIESSSYIMKSAKILSNTLPMLQNSLGNSFVENFIEMQTDIDVGNMKETLSRFSNMTVMLEKNKHILKQINTLSNLMVNISTCIKFDRYRGYDSADELNDIAQDLAKNRDLYASVIFKLPKDQGTSRRRRDSSSSNSSSLPPKVGYTIRMHMDNVMRTDRVRNPYFVKDTHISARQTLRYNRGFIYLQETIDRAIIETQTGHKVTEPAVQLQPFPYPCFLRDEYLEAISFVFPLMLMIAWVLFVADFVKKLVHERELRLHEYMKMMGVNPLSHFFAWFLECAAYLVLTIIILTVVLKCGRILPKSDSFLLFLYFCDYGLSILAISYLVSSFFDKTYIAGLSGSLIYMLSFFPFIVVIALESTLTFAQKTALSLFAPTCFSYASQYISRYESQGEGIQWSNSYVSPIAGDTASFGWLCWLMFIDSILYFIIGAYIRMVFPGKYGIPAPWYFPVKPSFWADLCCIKGPVKVGRGLLFTNIMQNNQPIFHSDADKGKDGNTFSSHSEEEFLGLTVGVALHGLTKMYGERAAIQNLNVTFYEGHVTSLLGHNGAGKTTTMSLLTGLFAPSSGTIEVYGRDMQANMDDIRKELGVCMQYDVHFNHMTAKEHLLLYGQIKAPHWSRRELHEQVRKTLEETGMYTHRHKRVGTLSGGMKRKLSISIAFIGGSRLVVLDEPTTGVDPCSRRSIWDIVIQHKRDRTIIMSTHHLDEAEVLSDRIAFLEKGGLKCCGSPLQLKDRLGQGYNLTLTKKLQNPDSEVRFDTAELKAFIQAHMPEARQKEGQVGDLVYSLPPFSSSNASSYRSLLTALDANLDALQLGCYGISDTTLEEVFLQLTQDDPEPVEDKLLSVSESVSDSGSVDGFPEDLTGSTFSFSDKTRLASSSVVQGLALVWQQVTAILIKRFHHSRRDWKGLISQVLLPVVFVVFAMGLGSIKSDLQHYPEMELSPALYNLGPSYSFFSNQNPKSSRLVDTMMAFPGMDNACLKKPDNPTCSGHTQDTWRASRNTSQPFTPCICTLQQQMCTGEQYHPPHKEIPSSQIVYNLTGIDVENYLLATANDYIRNRYGGFVFGKPLPPSLLMDLTEVPKNRTLAKVWYNPEGHHTMPAYLNSLNNFILRSNLPADKDPRKYAISVSSHPYFGRADDEDSVVQGMIQILVALCVLTGYAITTSSFAIYEVHEHHSGSKRLQHIAGIGEPFYWAVNFFYDMVLYLIPVALTVGVIAAFQIPAFTNRQNLAAVTLLLVLFGFSTFPWMYLLSGIFRDPEMAFITFVCINLFISVNTIMSTSILYFLGQLAAHGENIQETFQQLSKAFLIFPQFSFGNGLMELARVNMEVQILSGYGIDAYKNPFSTDALGLMFISSFLQGLVLFTLRLLLNKWLIRKVRHLIMGRKTLPKVAREDEDEDVLAEHQRVSSGAASSDVLQVNQLTKIYQHLNRKVHAVKRLSVGIPAGECFGLLGVNGAGKTTTFKMLTGDVSPTDGTAQIKDWDGRMIDIMECRNQGINIGYCPQVDALDDLLTGEEHMHFYARIRGIPKREINGVVNYLIKKLELGYHKNNVTDGYSCGTRRKLSTALALIGHPQILLLDEPSSGMDPRTKRHLWKIISEEVKGKCAVVLTSHSMEECEALCNRLAIMVKGQFRCLGSLQHIKNRFGSGFTVKMYLAKASCDVEAITSIMQHHFPSTYLKDHHSAMVEYHVPIAPGGVADIFDQLESNKTTLQIKHFSVSQTTLDEVFINFAMGKVGMESIPLHGDVDSHSLDSIEALET